VSKFEVLVRLVDESGDMILPGEFFAMAEGAGYADEVDRFVIENTMKVMSENRDQQTKFFVKLTRQSVADDNLPDWVVQKIGEYGIKPELLVFEISENVMQSDLKNVGRLSTALNEAGCKIAIEHYRMSTNMQHLMHVHTDYLKIDQGLVGSIEGKGSSLAKVTAIMELARDNNYITIAEGVETPGCLAILWELGVSMAQGYFIQAPAAIRANVDHDILSECSDDTGNKAKFEVS
jgi:EAL domain-containing protein (putative c-di-GMP-specific phosphodiesterase class I)